MGCCSSTNTDDRKCNDTTNGYYGSTRQGSKRSFSSRDSNGSSSGVSTAYTSPSRRSIFSRSSTNSPTSTAPKVKTRKFTLTPTDVPSKEIEMLSICDDFCEGKNLLQNNQSYGYYSESMSTGSGASTESQLRVRTQDTSSLVQESTEAQIILPPSPCDLEMEMYMMYNSPCLMPKTSSPIFQRRDVTYNAVAAASPPSRSFQRWSNYLQNTPPYMLNNITRIPEAIAGHFSPFDFPAYTDLEEMESAAKRFKVDVEMMLVDHEEYTVFQQHQLPVPSNVTHTVSTDL